MTLRELYLANDGWSNDTPIIVVKGSHATILLAGALQNTKFWNSRVLWFTGNTVIIERSKK